MANFVSITEVTSNMSSIEIISLPVFSNFHFEYKKNQSNFRGGGGSLMKGWGGKFDKGNGKKSQRDI